MAVSKPISTIALVLMLSTASCGGGSTSKTSSSDTNMAALGKRVYNQQCITCHQANGRGVPHAYPTLHDTDWTTGDKGRLIRLVLGGMEGEITVKGKSYNAVMTAHGPILNDKQIAGVLTYVRQNFGNSASGVSTDEVTRVRMGLDHEGTWQADVLQTRTGIPSK